MIFCDSILPRMSPRKVTSVSASANNDEYFEFAHQSPAPRSRPRATSGLSNPWRVDAPASMRATPEEPVRMALKEGGPRKQRRMRDGTMAICWPTTRLASMGLPSKVATPSTIEQPLPGFGPPAIPKAIKPGNIRLPESAFRSSGAGALKMMVMVSWRRLRLRERTGEHQTASRALHCAGGTRGALRAAFFGWYSRCFEGFAESRQQQGKLTKQRVEAEMTVGASAATSCPGAMPGLVRILIMPVSAVRPHNGELLPGIRDKMMPGVSVPRLRYLMARPASWKASVRPRAPGAQQARVCRVKKTCLHSISATIGKIPVNERPFLR